MAGFIRLMGKLDRVELVTKYPPKSKTLLILPDNVPDSLKEYSELYTGGRGGVAEPMRPNIVENSDKTFGYDLHCVGVPSMKGDASVPSLEEVQKGFDRVYFLLGTGAYDKVAVPYRRNRDDTSKIEPSFRGGVADYDENAQKEMFDPQFKILEDFMNDTTTPLEEKIKKLPLRYQEAYNQGRRSPDKDPINHALSQPEVQQKFAEKLGQYTKLGNYDKSKSDPLERLRTNAGKLFNYAPNRMVEDFDKTGFTIGFDSDDKRNEVLKKLIKSGIVAESIVMSGRNSGLSGIKMDATQAQKFFKELLNMPPEELENLAKPFAKPVQQQQPGPQTGAGQSRPLRKFPQTPPPQLPKISPEVQKLKEAYIQKIIDELKKLPPIKMGDTAQVDMKTSIENIEKSLQKCPTVFNVLEHATEYLMNMANNDKISNDDKRALFKASSDILDIDVQQYLPKPAPITTPTILPQPTTQPPQPVPKGQTFGDFTKGKAPPLPTVDGISAKYVLTLTIPNYRSSPGHNYFTITSTIFNEAGKIADKSRIVSPMFMSGCIPGSDIERNVQQDRDVKAFEKYIKNHIDEAKAGTQPVPRRLLIPLGLQNHECGLVVDIDKEGKSKILFFDPLGSPSPYKNKADTFIKAIKDHSSSSEEYVSETKYQDLGKRDFNCGTWTLWYLLEKASKDVPLSELAKRTEPTENKEFIQRQRIGYIDGLHATLKQMDPRSAYIADINTMLNNLPEFKNKEANIKVLIDILASDPTLGVKQQTLSFLDKLSKVPELQDKKVILDRIAESIRHDGVDESKFAAPVVLTGPGQTVGPQAGTGTGPQGDTEVEQELFHTTHPPVTPQLHQTTSRTTVATTDKSVTLEEFATKCKDNAFQAEHKITNLKEEKDQAGNTKKLSMDINYEGTKTCQCYVEKMNAEGGVAVSMNKIDDKDERLKALEKVVNATIASLKPGQEVKIPQGHPDKDKIEEFAKVAIKKQCEKLGLPYSNDLKIPKPPQQTQRQTMTH